MVEGVIEVQGVRVAVAGLKVSETVECTAEGTCHVHLFVSAEAVGDKSLCQHVDHPLDGGLQFRVSGTRVPVSCRILTGMVPDHATPRCAHRTDRVVASHSDRGIGQPSGDDLSSTEAQCPHQGVVAVDVAVEGRLADAQLGCHPGEGECLESLGVDQMCCTVDYLCRIEGLSAHDFTLALGVLTSKLWSRNYS